MKKDLVIIHGVTGAIGSACLAYFAAKENTVVYGISRRALSFEKFCISGKLPIKTVVCSIGNYQQDENLAHSFIKSFLTTIDRKKFNRLIYIHAVGYYPFEINESGNHHVLHDDNRDGIDDRCTFLTLKLFGEFFKDPQMTGMHSFIFGGLADVHKPLVHTSWWKTIEQLKRDVAGAFSKKHLPYLFDYHVSLLNISSVICPNELISRPFVFSATDADPSFWLQPCEIPPFLNKIFESGQVENFKEYSFFKKSNYFFEDYYTDKHFTKRKFSELYK